MTVQDVINRIAETLQVPPDQLTLESRSADFDAWDSLGTMSLLLMLTSDYELTVPQGETQKLVSVKGIVELFERRESSRERVPARRALLPSRDGAHE